MPLKEIIGEVLGVGPASKKVAAAYDALVSADGAAGWSELGLLMDVPLEEIAARSGPLAAAIGNMRAGKVTVTPGYDGEYGTVQCLT
jgi:PHP family Zn ribbon phosphoesterase